MLQEMTFLHPQIANKAFLRNESINIHCLCQLCNVNETEAIAELKKLAPAFLDHRQQFKAEGNTATDIGHSKTVRPHKKKCYCIYCLLEYINAESSRKEEYKNIREMLKFIAILPATQVKCERDFSTMKIIKNRLRSSLQDDSLENLMILSLESDLFKRINVDDIVLDIMLGIV